MDEDGDWLRDGIAIDDSVGSREGYGSRGEVSRDSLERGGLPSYLETILVMFEGH